MKRKTDLFLRVGMLMLFLCTGLFANGSDNGSSLPRSYQLGADVVIPYRTTDPGSGSLGTQVGGHVEGFFTQTLSLGVQGVVGVTDRGFGNRPVYVSPGFGFYPRPGGAIEPYLHVDAPILLTNDREVGVRGGGGFLWDIMKSGLCVRYSFDAGYFFDSEDVILDFANASFVLNF